MFERLIKRVTGYILLVAEKKAHSLWLLLPRSDIRNHFTFRLATKMWLGPDATGGPSSYHCDEDALNVTREPIKREREAAKLERDGGGEKRRTGW